MAGVGGIGDGGQPGEPIAIEIERSQRPVGIVRPQRHDLRLTEDGPVRPGIDDVDELAAAFGEEDLFDAPRGVIVEHLRHPAAEGGQLQRDMAFEPEHVDDSRNEADDTSVGGGREPARPAPFARAPEDESIDADARFSSHLADDVHRSHDRPGHREEERPIGLTGADKLHKRIGNEVILHHPAEHRLEGNLSNHGRRQAGGSDKTGQPAHAAGRMFERSIGRRKFNARATADPQQHRPSARRRGGEDDVKLVDPRHPAPGLARKPESLPGGSRLGHSLTHHHGGGAPRGDKPAQPLEPACGIRGNGARGGGWGGRGAGQGLVFWGASSGGREGPRTAATIAGCRAHCPPPGRGWMAISPRN